MRLIDYRKKKTYPKAMVSKVKSGNGISNYKSGTKDSHFAFRPDEFVEKNLPADLRALCKRV